MLVRKAQIVPLEGYLVGAFLEIFLNFVTNC